MASTQSAAELGDRDWQALLDATTPRPGGSRAFPRPRGETSGDGGWPSSTLPAGDPCAISIRDGVQALGIEVRAGLHTGECEVRGDDIGGIAVHIGARVSALAEPNEYWIQHGARPRRRLGLEFEDHGAHELKGVPGSGIFAVAASRSVRHPALGSTHIGESVGCPRMPWTRAPESERRFGGRIRSSVGWPRPLLDRRATRPAATPCRCRWTPQPR